MGAVQTFRNGSLSVSSLCVSRGLRGILKDINFSLEPGDGVFVRGKNGVGKTTLLRTIAGFIKPHAGSISLQRKSILYLDEKGALPFDVRVSEYLDFLDAYYACFLDRTRFGVNKFSHKVVQELSSGQRQLVRLLRLQRPGSDVWLLDEPFSSLDAENQSFVAKEIKSFLLEKRGICIISIPKGTTVKGLEWPSIEL